ncbi:MAG: hypothetical protein Q9167_007606 [Letrouitia subvulpina]
MDENSLFQSRRGTESASQRRTAMVEEHKLVAFLWILCYDEESTWLNLIQQAVEHQLEKEEAILGETVTADWMVVEDEAEDEMIPFTFDVDNYRYEGHRDNSQVFRSGNAFSALFDIFQNLRSKPQGVRPARGTSVVEYSGDVEAKVRFSAQGGALSYHECSIVIRALANYMGGHDVFAHHPSQGTIYSGEEARLEFALFKIPEYHTIITAQGMEIAGWRYPTRALPGYVVRNVINRALTYFQRQNPTQLIPTTEYKSFLGRNVLFQLDFRHQGPSSPVAQTTRGRMITILHAVQNWYSINGFQALVGFISQDGETVALFGFTESLSYLFAGSSENSQSFEITNIRHALETLILELRHLPQNERPAAGTSLEQYSGDAQKSLRFMERGGQQLNYRECSNLIQALHNFLGHQAGRDEHPFHVAISRNDQTTLELTVNRISFRELYLHIGSWYVEGPIYPTRRLQSAAGRALLGLARHWASSHDPHILIPQEVYMIFRAQGKYLDIDFGPPVREGTSRISYGQFIVVLDGLNRYFDEVGWNVFGADITSRGYHKYVVAMMVISESEYGSILQPTGNSGIENQTLAATSVLSAAQPAATEFTIL